MGSGYRYECFSLLPTGHFISSQFITNKQPSGMKLYLIRIMFLSASGGQYIKVSSLAALLKLRPQYSQSLRRVLSPYASITGLISLPQYRQFNFILLSLCGDYVMYSPQFHPLSPDSLSVRSRAYHHRNSIGHTGSSLPMTLQIGIRHSFFSHTSFSSIIPRQPDGTKPNLLSFRIHSLHGLLPGNVAEN